MKKEDLGIKLDEDALKALKDSLYLERKDKGMLDALQEKIISRKLFVLLLATMLLKYSGLESDTWGMLAMTYIGGQAAVDFAKVWRR
jgi:hypothetical protein